MGVPVDEAEDAAHEVFIVLHRRGDVIPASALRGWLRGVTVQVCRNRRRANTRRSCRLVLVDSAELDPSNEGHNDGSIPLEELLARRELRRAFRRLDLPKQIVLQLSVFEGLTAAEIGQRLEISSNTVASRLRAAKRRLRNAIEPANAPLDDLEAEPFAGSASSAFHSDASVSPG